MALFFENTLLTCLPLPTVCSCNQVLFCALLCIILNIKVQDLKNAAINDSESRVFWSVLQSRPFPKTFTLLTYFSVSVGIAVSMFAKTVTWLACSVYQSVLQSRPSPKHLRCSHMQYFCRYCSLDRCLKQLHCSHILVFPSVLQS